MSIVVATTAVAAIGVVVVVLVAAGSSAAAAAAAAAAQNYALSPLELTSTAQHGLTKHFIRASMVHAFSCHEPLIHGFEMCEVAFLTH